MAKKNKIAFPQSVESKKRKQIKRVKKLKKERRWRKMRKTLGDIFKSVIANVIYDVIKMII